MGGTSAGFAGSGGQFLEHFKQKDWTYDTILDDGKGTEESIGEDAFDCVACDSLADTQVQATRFLVEGLRKISLPGRLRATRAKAVVDTV